MFSEEYKIERGMERLFTKFYVIGRLSSQAKRSLQSVSRL